MATRVFLFCEHETSHECMGWELTAITTTLSSSKFFLSKFSYFSNRKKTFLNAKITGQWPRVPRSISVRFVKAPKHVFCFSPRNIAKSNDKRSQITKEKHITGFYIQHDPSNSRVGIAKGRAEKGETLTVEMHEGLKWICMYTHTYRQTKSLKVLENPRNLMH